METKNSQNRKGNPRIHVRITPENSMDANDVPVTVPRSFLSATQIMEQEANGRTIMFVVHKIHSSSPKGKTSTDLKPLRDTAGNYLVVVCW